MFSKYPNNYTNECIIITEASSSKTAFFSYNTSFDTQKINGKSKLTLSSGQKPELYKMDSYAMRGNVDGYYAIIRNIINDHMFNSHCNKFYWAILATGGMRNLPSDDKTIIQKSFYYSLKKLCRFNSKIYNSGYCKEITLVKAETITGETEGRYSWLSLRDKNDHHAVIDLGGQTGQFTNRTYTFSDNLGKELAIEKITSSSPLDNHDVTNSTFYNYTIETCYNDISSKYDGVDCRQNIMLYIDTNFANKLPQIHYDQYSKLYVISNFYNYLLSICESYLPYVVGNKLKIDSDIQIQVEELCDRRDIDSLAIRIDEYRDITDEMCKYWNDLWEGEERHYAKTVCFSGNYNYQLLQSFGLKDKDIVYVDKSDWALGAAMSITDLPSDIGTKNKFANVVTHTMNVRELLSWHKNKNIYDNDHDE